jgi:hypothetical protein
VDARPALSGDLPGASGGAAGRSSRPGEASWLPSAGTLVVFLSYLALSAAWSWPLARLDPDTLVTRQFDLYPTIWLLARAPAAFPTLQHAASAWPFGESLARLDSYVFLVVAWVVDGRIDPRTLAGLFAWFGPALGALAAERCAACAFGVPRPASWIAGAMYGFSGVAATALLEGHVYYAFDPWLPLLLWAAWRATADDGGVRHGFAAAVAWALGLATTAYAGVLGGAVLVVVALRGGTARLAPGLLLVGLPAGLLYVHLYTEGGMWTDMQAYDPSQVLRMGSATLGSLGGWSDALDLRAHSIAASVGWTGFWLCLLAPVVLRGQRGWRTLLGLSVLALLVSLGRSIRLIPGGDPWWSPIALLVEVPGAELFRFPVRASALYALCGGVVAARVAAALAAGLPGRVRPWLVGTLLVLVAGDAIVGTGLPWRIHGQIGTTPSAYDAAPPDRAVLDLWPRVLDPSAGEVEMWSRALSCFYQAHHARPVLEVCIGTSVESPREVVDRWLTAKLLRFSPDFDDLRARLGALGVGAVALHADLYRPNDRDALSAALQAAFGAAAADTLDGGEHVRLWVVPPVADPDPAAAWAAIGSGW